ncbi:MAG: radical SAM protein [Treponema sp.]|nr:radical SAM protein [Treponema sp.]
MKQIVYLATDRCNMRCKFCKIPKTDMKKHMEIASLELLRHFDESPFLKTLSNIAIAGGEPFLKDDIQTFISGMEERGIRCNITSNGYFTGRIQHIVNYLKSVESVGMAISIDGFERTHDHIRNTRGAFKNAVNTVKFLKQSGVSVQVNTVLDKENIDEMDDFKDFISSLDVRHSLIPKLSCQDVPYDYDEDEARKVLPHMQIIRDIKYVISRGNFTIQNCHAGIESCCLDADGNIYACLTGAKYLKNTEDYYLGNLHASSFDAIMGGGTTQRCQMRRLLHAL